MKVRDKVMRKQHEAMAAHQIGHLVDYRSLYIVEDMANIIPDNGEGGNGEPTSPNYRSSTQGTMPTLDTSEAGLAAAPATNGVAHAVQSPITGFTAPPVWMCPSAPLSRIMRPATIAVLPS